MKYAMNVPRNEWRCGAARLMAGILVASLGGPLWARDGGGSGAVAASLAAAEPGLHHLLTRAYLPADFDQEVFDELWTTWEEPARSRAERAPLAERRRLTMDRYGLLPLPDDPSRSYQYVVDAAGRWTMSCLACHQGQVGGRVIPGLPNTTYALETLTDEVRQVKIRQAKPLGHMDLGGLLMPLGTTVGTTNAVMFGVALMRHRDADLAIVTRPPRFDLSHHDMDAPPWWHYRRRRSLYVDGFAPQGHRMLMQFLLVKENGPERFREWEEEFRAIERWIAALEPPTWPGAIDRDLVARGAVVYADHCAECHGTAGDRGPLPERVVPEDEIGTDPVRLASLSAADRAALNASWFGHHGADREQAGLAAREAGTGYVAPPLDGIWASAPYFHNGAVPTLWHVLHPDARPTVWRRTATGYDEVRVGLEVEEFADVPADLRLPSERRRVFDTRRPGKSAAGHDYPAALSADERAVLLEFLKTL